MRHVWIADVEFALGFGRIPSTLRSRLSQRTYPNPTPRSDDVYRAAGAVEAINQPVFGRQRYRSLAAKLAALVYELCKQHFFVNGNKRIAYFFLLYALILNGRMIDIDTFEERAELMEHVADSDPRDRKKVLRELTELIGSKMRPFDVQTAAVTTRPSS